MFLVRPSVYKDESSLSFMLRIANRNGYLNIAGMLNAIGYCNIKLTSKYLRAGYWESLQMHGFDVPDEFIGLEVAGVQSHVGEWLKVTLSSSYFRRDCNAVCPVCLSDGAYSRSVWDYRIYTTCHRHSCLLVSQCPGCSNHLNWMRSSIELCSCGFDLRGAAQHPGDTESATTVWQLVRAGDRIGVQSLTAFFDACIRAHGEDAEPGMADSFLAWHAADDAALVQRMLDLAIRRLDVLHPRLALLPFLRLGARIRKCAAGALLSLENVQIPRCSAKLLPDRLSRTDALVALGIGSHQVLNQLNRRKLINKQPITKTMRKGVYEVAAVDSLLRRLWRPSSETRRTPPAHCMGLDKVVESALAHPHKSAGYSMLHGLTSLRMLEPLGPSVSSDESALLSIPELGKRLGVQGEIIRSLIQRKYLDSTKGTPKYPTVVLIDEFNRFNEKYVFARTLAKQVGACTNRFAEKLYAHGIDPVGGPTIDGLKIYLFKRSRLEGVSLKMIAGLRGRTIVSVAENAMWRARFVDRLRHKAITLEDAAEDLKIRPRDVTALLRKGYLQRALMPGTRVMIDYVTFLTFFRQFTDPKMITLANAAAGCGETIQQFVSRWVKTGLVKPVNMGICFLIPLDDYNNVVALHRDYVTGAEAGKMLGIGRSAALNKVRRNVLQGSKVIGEGTRFWLFARQDVEQMVEDIKKLNRK